MTATRELVIWGASGHALVVADIIRLRAEYRIIGFLDDVNPDRKNAVFCGSRILGGQEQLVHLREQGVDHIILGFGDCEVRLELSELVRELGFSLATAIHPRAIVAADASIGAGTVIVAGSVVNPGACIGENVIINTGASVDHECFLEDGVHIAPGARLGGRVRVGRAAWVGIGSTVKEDVHIGPGSLIGAGAVVLSDIPGGVVACGVPARIVRKTSANSDQGIGGGSIEMATTTDSAVDYSIVIPVYFNEGVLTETMMSIKNDVIAHDPSLCCEVIFVDDGSGDGSLDEVLRLREEDQQIVRVIKLTRNFGQVNALMAGFSLARGKCAIAMSADGQDPAVLINEMLEAHFEEQFEVVVCARRGRDESWYRILTSKLFYALMRRLSFPNMPSGGFDFVLLGRRALDVLMRNQETHLFFQGQILWMGFRTKFIEYRRLERRVGQSRWTFGKKLTYLIDGAMSYSFLPIRLMSGMGILAALLGFLYAVIVVVIKVVWDNPIPGWTPLMTVILIMGGFQMLMLGVSGEYLWRTLAEARCRPRYIIEAVFDQHGQQRVDGHEGQAGNGEIGPAR